MARPAGRGRLTCEDCFSIDVRQWSRRGLLQDGWEFPWFWNRASMSVYIKADLAVLSFYSQNPGEIASRSVEQRVPILRTACHLGGQRAWFRCTVHFGGKHCGRRAAILYSAGDLFACRRCYGLAYMSQRESRTSRSISRAQKIRTLLGSSPNLSGSFPPKPPRMHWRTYDRLRTRGEAADELAFGHLQSWLGRVERQAAALHAMHGVQPARRPSRRTSKKCSASK
jgi:hypothetical protein